MILSIQWILSRFLAGFVQKRTMFFQKQFQPIRAPNSRSLQREAQHIGHFVGIDKDDWMCPLGRTEEERKRVMGVD